ncbi:MAG: DNA (cytosine-5-)-methyltransferase [Gemmatimonadetes bacterium]|nr:DNA (cytosine-5-)-methyltransferase [Gemmatimonadota bacterium]MYG36131.1 DNA (cytosine-5-)-methyltransferase [Gemmatimonadota bacterium]
MATLASFFAGIGGFDLGFEQAGFDVVFQCELDPHCRAILRRHWPDTPLHDDIRSLKPEDIPHADVWSAGWPCQDISNGHPQGAGLKNGKRSGLFFSFMDLVREVQPSWIVLENVPGLLSADQGAALESVIDEMEEAGYLGGWTTCNARDFGLPQNRLRVFLVGHLGGDGAYRVLAHGSKLRWDHQARGKQWADGVGEVQEGAGRDDPVVVQRRGGFGYTRERRVCPTLRSQGGKHQGGHSDRPILCGQELDVARVGTSDGVPGRLDGRRGRLIGNAVAVPIARWFAETILAVEAESLNGSPQAR